MLCRLILFAAAWLLLTEGSVRSPAIAVVAVTLAAAASLALQPPGGWRWRARGLLRFVPFFVAQSVAGGLDVARRAFDPRLPIEPGFVEFPARLPPGPARQFFIGAVGLLPGTLAAHVEEDHLIVHVLDRTAPFARTLRRLEERTADLFGCPPLP